MGKSDNRGRYTPARRSWLRITALNAILYRNQGRFLGALPEGSPLVSQYQQVIPDEYGDETKLVFESVGLRRFVELQLTDMTEVELTALHDFITAAFMNALPIVRERDRLAEEALHEYGDDSDPRVYRTLPAVHFRPGERSRYDEGVQRGLERAAAMVGKPDQLNARVSVLDLGPVRAGNPRLSARDPFGVQRGDDAAEGDDVQGVGTQQGDGELPF